MFQFASIRAISANNNISFPEVIVNRHDIAAQKSGVRCDICINSNSLLLAAL